MKKLSILFLVVGAALMMNFTSKPEVTKDVATFSKPSNPHSNYVQLFDVAPVSDPMSPLYTTAVNYNAVAVSYNAVICSTVWGICWCCASGGQGSSCWPSPGSCGGNDSD